MEHFIAAFLVCRSAVRYGLRAWTWDTSQSVQSLLHCTELQECTGTIYHYTQGCSLTQFCVLFMCRAVLFKLFISWKEWMLNVSWYVEHRGHFGCNTQSQNLSHLSQCNCSFYSTLYLSCKLDEDHFRTKILYFHFLSWMYVRSRLAVSGLCVFVCLQWRREQDFDLQLLERAVQGEERPVEYEERPVEHKERQRSHSDEWLTLSSTPMMRELDLEPLDYQLDLSKEVTLLLKGVVHPKKETSDNISLLSGTKVTMCVCFKEKRCS